MKQEHKHQELFTVLRIETRIEYSSICPSREISALPQLQRIELAILNRDTVTHIHTNPCSIFNKHVFLSLLLVFSYTIQRLSLSYTHAACFAAIFFLPANHEPMGAEGGGTAKGAGEKTSEGRRRSAVRPIRRLAWLGCHLRSASPSPQQPPTEPFPPGRHRMDSA